MSTPLTLIETSDFEADRISHENQLIDEALHFWIVGCSPAAQT
ncbi:DNA repair protein RadC [Pseudomonas chlororaphis subsp. piscium]|uniref:Protein RadC n=1 Tax=Pseudomonas chlororaphis TaxID=587753 RepID=A0AAX3FPV2_9PSED|nr:DNA repair protein RadC [Pseudomonas chlororaphis subsp. piscium]AZC44819.1 DNA repair protein RadC [Pseudomonas chlororaphis subsp. piscium]VEF72767.1 protein RadC [Pseudomonas chlororaphis]